MILRTLRVFVSSTWLDLAPERAAVEQALQTIRTTKFVGMEYFGSDDSTTRDVSLRLVDPCDLYVGIFGDRYGSGITEGEYRRARERGIPCLIYFKDAPVSANGEDANDAARLSALKTELGRDHTVSRFRTPHELAARLIGDLHNWLFDTHVVLGAQSLPGDFANRIQNFLGEYLGTTSHPVPFGGRDAEFGALDDWLDGADEPPSLVLAAPAGRGKSALLVRWTRRVANGSDVAVVFFPVSVRFRTNLASVVFPFLASRLAMLRGERAPGSADTPAEVWRDAMSGYLSRSLPGARQLLLVIDGLDEAADWEAGPDLFPFALGSKVRVLVSARALAGQIDAASWAERLGWSIPATARAIDLRALTRRGVADVLASAGIGELRGGDLESELFRLTEGDPLLVRLYVATLARSGSQGLSVEDLRRSQPGLEGYFSRWWEEQRRLWGTEAPLREPTVQAVLNLLACALGPLSQADLLRLMPAELEPNLWMLEDALRSLSRLMVGDGVSQGYAFSHPRLAGYFYEKLHRAGAHRKHEGRFAAWGEEVLRELNDGRRAPSDAPPYVVRYHRSHLERLGADVKDFLPLLGSGWRSAWEQIDRGSYSGFLTDVGAVRRVVEAFDARALKSGGTASHVGSQLLCVLCQSSIDNLTGNMPFALLAALSQREVWTAEQILAHVGRMSDVTMRFRHLVELAGHIPESHRATLLDAAFAVLSASGTVAGSPGQLTALLAPLRESLAGGPFDSPARRVSALCDLARRLPKGARAEVVVLLAPWACNSATGQDRHDLLKGLSALLSESQRQDIVSNVLAAVLPSVDGALAFLRVFQPGRALMDVVSTCVESAGAQTRHHLFCLAIEAESDEDPVALIGTLSRLAPLAARHLTRPQRSTVVGVAQTKLRGIRDPSLRCDGLIAFVSVTGPDGFWDILQSAWRASQGIAGTRERLRALVKLASRFSSANATMPSDLPLCVASEIVLLSSRELPVAHQREALAATAALAGRLPPAAQTVALEGMIDLAPEPRAGPLAGPTPHVDLRLRAFSVQIGRTAVGPSRAFLAETIDLLFDAPPEDQPALFVWVLGRLPLDGWERGPEPAGGRAHAPIHEFVHSIAARLKREEIPRWVGVLLDSSNDWGNLRRVVLLDAVLRELSPAVPEHHQRELYRRISEGLDTWHAAQCARVRNRKSLPAVRAHCESQRVRILMGLSAVVAEPMASQVLASAVARRDAELARRGPYSIERARERRALLLTLRSQTERGPQERSVGADPEPELLARCTRALADPLVADDVLEGAFRAMRAEGPHRRWASLWELLAPRLPAHLVPAAFELAWEGEGRYASDTFLGKIEKLWRRERGGPPVAEALEFLARLEIRLRVPAILALGKVLPPAVRAKAVDDVLRSVREATDTRGLDVVALLEPYVPEGEVPDLVKALRAGGPSCVEALAAYAHRLPRAEQRKLILEIVALSSAHPWSGRHATDALLRYPNPDEDLVEQVVDRVQGEANAIVPIVHLLSPRLLVAAAARAVTIGDRIERAWAVGELGLRGAETLIAARQAFSEVVAQTRAESPAELARILERAVPHVDRTCLSEFVARKVGAALNELRSAFGRGPPSLWGFEGLGHLVTEAPDATLDEVLQVALAREDETSRWGLLQCIVAALPKPSLERVVSNLLTMRSEELRAKALAGVAPYVSSSTLERILAHVPRVSDEALRAALLRDLAPLIPEAWLPWALYHASSFASGAIRALALTGLVPYVRDGARRGAAAKALASLDPRAVDGLSRAELRWIADAVPGELHAEALAAVARLSGFHRVRLLRVLAPKWPREFAGELIAAAQAIATKADRAEAMRWISIHLVGVAPERALRAVRAIEDPYERALALGQAARGLERQAERDAVREEALRAAFTVEDRAQRFERLVDLAPQLSPSGLAAVRAALFDADEPPDATNVAVLALSLPESLTGDAVNAVGRYADERTRVAALRCLAPSLGPGCIEGAIALCTKFRSDSLRAAAIQAIVPRVPEALEPSALSAAETIVHDSVRAELMCLLAQHFHAAVRIRSLDLALTAIGRLPDETYRASLLGRLGPELPEGLVGRAIALIAGLENEVLRAEALHGLPVPAEVIPEALLIARSFRDASLRAIAMAECCGRLPERERALVLAGAVATALAGEWKTKRVDTLVAMVTGMGVPSDFVQSQALQAAARLRDDLALGNAIEIMAPVLGEASLLDACTRVGPITDEAVRARAIAALAPHVGAEHFIDILAHVRALPTERIRAAVLCEIGPLLPEGLRSDAFALGRGLQSAVYRADVLVSLAPFLREPLLGAAVDEAFRTEDGEVRFEAVRRLLVYLPPTLLQDVLQRAKDLGQAHEETMRAYVMLLLGASTAGTGAARTFEWMEGPARVATVFDGQSLPETSRLHALLDEAAGGVERLRVSDAAVPEPAWTPDALLGKLRRLRELPAEIDRAEGLLRIAPDLQEDDLPTALELLHTLADANCRLMAIQALARARFSREALQRACDEACRSQSAPYAVDSINALVPAMLKVDTAELHELWCRILRSYSGRRRSDLLRLAGALSPVIERLGGDGALRDCMDAVRAATEWWP